MLISRMRDNGGIHILTKSFFKNARDVVMTSCVAVPEYCVTFLEKGTHDYLLH